MLFVYSSVDHYLKEDGILGFNITQTVFKTKGAGDGFRQFEYKGKTGKRGRPPIRYIKVLKALDLSEFQPFEKAANRTAIIVCQKAKEPTTYPIPYSVWIKKVRGKINPDWSLIDVENAVEIKNCKAIPINKRKKTSPWLTLSSSLSVNFRKVLRKGFYRAYAGSFTGGLNGCYWIQTIRKDAKELLISNLNDIGKIKVDNIVDFVEPDLVYPLLRGRDVRKWNARPSVEIILAQDPVTRKGIQSEIMRKKYPLTFSYFKKFEPLLRDRAGYKKYFNEADPFWSMFAIGTYTLSEWKVVFREQSANFQACVIDKHKGKTIIPDHKLMLIACNNGEDEAHFICSLLNSMIANLIVKSYTVSTSTSTHVLDYINIPKFDRRKKYHLELSELSKQAHKEAELGNIGKLREIEDKIDVTAAEFWGITKEELQNIKEALK